MLGSAAPACQAEWVRRTRQVCRVAVASFLADNHLDAPLMDIDEDFREKVIQEFPYPVAKLFVKLRTDECLDPGSERLRYILATSEAIARFLGIVVVCECRKLAEVDGVVVAGALSAQFPAQFRRPTFGTWTAIIRLALSFLKANNVVPLLTELPDAFFGRTEGTNGISQDLDRLLEVRNGLSHERIRAATAADLRRLCEDTYPLLCRVLQSLSFLTRYTMSFHSTIEVQKPRRQAPRFLHRYKLIRGTSDFPGRRQTLDNFLDPQAVLLTETVPSTPPRHLSLDPLFVHDEECGRAPDIFYFNGIKEPGVAEYSSCSRANESFVSASSARAAEIAAELEHLVALFAPAGHREEAR